MPMNPRLMRPLARRQAPSDPYLSSVSLLLHFDGSFADSSTNAVTLTASGDAATSNAVKKFGTHAGYFDGDSDYIYLTAETSPLFGFGTGDFTLECWVYPLDTASNDVIIDTRPFDAGLPLVFGRSSAGELRWYNGATVFTAGSIPQDEWSHIAWSRSGGTSRLYVNGVEVYSFADASDCGTERKLTIGANASPEFENFYGYIDDLRITKGTARYTAAFTPPTAPFPNIGPPAPPAPSFQPIPVMTSATTPSGEASASAILAQGLEAWRAFDKETVSGDTTFYASAVGAVGEWIQYDFGFTVTAGGYQIHSRVLPPYGYVQAPPAWTLSGSVDGVNFTTIDTRTGVTDWNSNGELKTFTLSSPASYRYWRWTWDAVPPEPAVVLPKIQLVE